MADVNAVLPEHDEYFTEQVWRLPGGVFLAGGDEGEPAPALDPRGAARAEVTFACFAAGGAITLPLVEHWATLLHRVPGARLLLRNAQLSPPDNRDYMERRFRRFGIGRDRLTLHGDDAARRPADGFAGVDVVLDTWPVGGGESVRAALWHGVPVVSLAAERVGGRDGASLLLAAGCGELVARTPAEYVSIAAGLGASPERLIRYRTGLRDAIAARGLADARAFTRRLEAACLGMMERLHRAARRPAGAAR
jgi:predicted O-linked N-acetylglucosamine transferase (SPINDLY family)